MTQFALVKTSNNFPGLKPVSELRDDFLAGVASKLFPGSSSDKIFVFDVNGKDVDGLMLDAQKHIVGSSKFEETVLFHTIGKVARAVDEIILWYASDYENLECVYNVSTLLRKLEEAVSDSTCEIYIHYKKMKQNR